MDYHGLLKVMKDFHGFFHRFCWKNRHLNLLFPGDFLVGLDQIFSLGDPIHMADALSDWR